MTESLASTSSVPVGIAVFAPDLRLLHCDQHFPDVTGLTHDRLPAGLTFSALLAAFHRQRRSGRVIDVQSKPLPDGGQIMIVADVTRLRETENALRLSRAAAEAGHAAKTRFLAAMDTELRTPLVSILGETSAMATIIGSRARLSDPAQLTRSCAAIEEAARSLLGMIDAILDIVRRETDGFALADQPVDLAKLLRSILRRFDPVAAAAEVTLVIDLPVSLPAIRGDDLRLRQALSDVVATALSRTVPAGSVSIRARHDWATGGLLMEIQDTSPGLTEEELDRLFDPFPCLGASARSGNGLGLHAGRLVMRAHGGDLVLRSIPGQGTTTILTFPSARVVQDSGCDANS